MAREELAAARAEGAKPAGEATAELVGEAAEADPPCREARAAAVRAAAERVAAEGQEEAAVHTGCTSLGLSGTSGSWLGC